MSVIPIASVEVRDDEIQAAVEVIRSGRLIQGQVVRDFEEKFAGAAGVAHAVAVSSGSAALHVAYCALGIEPGDEILAPTFSHISTASMIELSGARAVMCDVDPRTYTIDLDDARSRVTSRTRAIVPVHLFGNAADVDGVRELAAEHELEVIWDAAQATGTRYRGRDIGSIGDAVCYSFYPTKNMTTGEGGMIVTDDAGYAERCRMWRSHGQERKYYHVGFGFNYRLTDIMAAVGVRQLDHLDAAIARRRDNAARLTAGLDQLPGILTPVEQPGAESTYNQYCPLVDAEAFGATRDELVEHLRGNDIQVGIHYPRPIHKQPVFLNMSPDVMLPVSEALSETIMALPVHPGLTNEQIDRIVETVATASVRVAG